MTIQEIGQEIRLWKFTKQRALHFIISTIALLLYEFVGRPIYRPYIYRNNIFDFHIADTLGNTLGTIATVFVTLALLARTPEQHRFLIVVTTLAGTVFELLHPLVGKPIDFWDLVATPIAGAFCFGLYRLLVGNTQLN